MISVHLESRQASAEELKRIALELLDDALRRLRSRSARLRARNGHQTRKRLKKLRAVVRLLDSGARLWTPRALESRRIDAASAILTA